MRCRVCMFFFFFFNDTATTEIYTLSLHDALPISCATCASCTTARARRSRRSHRRTSTGPLRSEEHTSELQSQSNLVCRLLLEKKKTQLLSCASFNTAILTPQLSVNKSNLAL